MPPVAGCRVPNIMAHHDVMSGEELDELYGGRPEEFTARRKELVAAARKRGDDEAAKLISAARKPTTAAWVVNLLALRNDDVKRSLTDLRERLRAAHAAMDGAAIRDLSAEQRTFVDELTRAAFDGAEVTHPSTSLREDVTATLQAAVADPDVGQRLGHLAKAEQWSGFGDFGTTTAVFSTARGAKAKAEPGRETRRSATDGARGDEREATRQAHEAKAAVTAAEKAKDEADNELSDRQTDLAVARLRRDEMRERLAEAERTLSAADKAYSAAKQASREAADLVDKAKSRLKRSTRTR